jgi:hypothetical protein
MADVLFPLTDDQLAALYRAINGAGWPRPKRCCVCHMPASLVALTLCDAPQAPYGTCDIPVCVYDATHVGSDTHYCPHHAFLATTATLA